MKRLGFDVLVVGAGPAGLAAAASAARGGARVGLVDDNPAIGGQIWRGTQSAPAGQASRWLAGVGDERVSVLARTRIIAPLGRGALLAAAAYLAGKGAQVVLIAEQATWTRLGRFAFALRGDPGKLGQAGHLGWNMRGVPYRAGCWVMRAHGTDRLEAITMRHPRGTWTRDCDYLACGFGLVPNLELPLALGCAIGPDSVRVDEWQQTSVERVYGAGEVTGIGGLDAALVEGRIAGLAATGQRDAARGLFKERARTQRFAAALGRAFAPHDELKTLADADTIVCRCEDVLYRDLRSYASWRDAKLHARCGMGPPGTRVRRGNGVPIRLDAGVRAPTRHGRTPGQPRRHCRRV